MCCPFFQPGDGIIDLIVSDPGPSGLNLQLLDCLFFNSRSTSKEPLCVWAALDCLQLCVFLATLFAVSMIAVDCFLKIKIPLKYRATVTKRRLTVAIIISWLLSISIGLVVMFGIGHISFPFQDMSQNRTNIKVQPLAYDNRTKNNCTVLAHGCNKLNVYYENGKNAPVSADDTSLCRLFAIWGIASKNLFTGLCSLLCTALVISLYCCICCRVKKLQNRTERLTGVQTGSRKTVITTSFIVGSFLLAWGPPWILLMFPLIFAGVGLQPAERALISSTNVLQVLNATLDALIYAIRLEEIRQGYRIAFDKLKYRCFRILGI